MITLRPSHISVEKFHIDSVMSGQFGMPASQKVPWIPMQDMEWLENPAFGMPTSQMVLWILHTYTITREQTRDNTSWAHRLEAHIPKGSMDVSFWISTETNTLARLLFAESFGMPTSQMVLWIVKKWYVNGQRNYKKKGSPGVGG